MHDTLAIVQQQQQQQLQHQHRHKPQHMLCKKYQLYGSNDSSSTLTPSVITIAKFPPSSSNQGGNGGGGSSSNSTTATATASSSSLQLSLPTAVHHLPVAITTICGNNALVLHNFQLVLDLMPFKKNLCCVIFEIYFLQIS